MTESGRARRRPLLAAFLAVVLLGGVLTVRSGPAWARWSDDVPLTGAAFSAASVPRPGGVVCADRGASLEYSWNHVDTGVDYLVTIRNGGTVGSGSILQGPVLFAGPSSPQRVAVTLTPSSGLNVGTFTRNISIVARNRAAPTWTSPLAGGTFSESSILIIGLDMACGTVLP